MPRVVPFLKDCHACHAASECEIARANVFRHYVCDAPSAHAQTSAGPEQSHGTLVIVPSYGEVTHANDQAHATLQAEEQDKGSCGIAREPEIEAGDGNRQA